MKKFRKSVTLIKEMISERLDSKPREHLLLTGNAGDFFSAYVHSPGDSNPIDYFQDRTHSIYAYNPFITGEESHHRAICGPASEEKSIFVVKDLVSHMISDPMVWVVDLSASYLDFFELLKEDSPANTAIIRVSHGDINFAFNPFLFDDQYSDAPKEHFELCAGLLKIMVGAEFRNAESEESVREGLKAFFNAYRILLRNRTEAKPVQPLSLLFEIFEKKLRHPGLAAALQRWTTGRRGDIFNTGRDMLQSARYCYFDLRGMDDEPEFAAAIVYMIFSKVYRDIADEKLQDVQKRFILAEANRYITDPAFSFWLQQLTSVNRQGNFMLDLITPSINDIAESDAIMKNLKQAFFFPGQENIEDSFRKLQMTDANVEQYNSLDPSLHEVLYWSDGGVKRILRWVVDPYTYWLAIPSDNEREMRRRMKERFGNIRAALGELVRVTAGCKTTTERLTALKRYFKNS